MNEPPCESCRRAEDDVPNSLCLEHYAQMMNARPWKWEPARVGDTVRATEVMPEGPPRLTSEFVVTHIDDKGSFCGALGCWSRVEVTSRAETTGK